jgi:hypothetical protein
VWSRRVGSPGRVTLNNPWNFSVNTVSREVRARLLLQYVGPMPLNSDSISTFILPGPARWNVVNILVSLAKVKFVLFTTSREMSIVNGAEGDSLVMDTRRKDIVDLAHIIIPEIYYSLLHITCFESEVTSLGVFSSLASNGNLSRTDFLSTSSTKSNCFKPI